VDGLSPHEQLRAQRGGRHCNTLPIPSQARGAEEREFDNHIRLRCEGLQWTGDRTIDGGGPVVHQSRLGAGVGEYCGNDRESDGRWTKADSKVIKGVGHKVDQGAECQSGLLARIVYDKDNPDCWWNTVQRVVMMRE
jgi:hypothetical protein